MMFRDDFEFSAKAAPSHLGHAGPIENKSASATMNDVGDTQKSTQVNAEVFNGCEPVNLWDAAAEKELGKIPFFVRGKARRNTEKFAVEHGISQITIETLYDAKAHYGR